MSSVPRVSPAAVLVLRIWSEVDDGIALRARITQTGDATQSGTSTVIAGTPGDICAAVLAVAAADGSCQHCVQRDVVDPADRPA